MVFKWNDTTERMVLLKMLEQNHTIKLDVSDALKNWPSDLEKPTPRSIGDRYNLLKKQIRDGNIRSSQGVGGVGLSARSLPTPPSFRRASDSAHKKRAKITKRTRKVDAGDYDDDSDDDMEESDLKLLVQAGNSNPIRNAKGSSSSQFTKRLLGNKNTSKVAVKNTAAEAEHKSTSNVKKRKRGKDDDTSVDEEEDSMTERGSIDSEDNDQDGVLSTPSLPRRTSLPRRSKSVTPGRVDCHRSSQFKGFDDVDGSPNSLMHALARESKQTRQSYNRDADDEEDIKEEDSDSMFEPQTVFRHHFSHKQSKLGWQERIARNGG